MREVNSVSTQSNEPVAQPAGGPAAVPQGTPTPPGERASAPMFLEPSEAEIDAWAERERTRREAWLGGPTVEERAAWATRERERRLAGLKAEQRAEAMPLGRRGAYLVREAQLAAEGALSLLSKEVTAEGMMGAFQKWSGRGLAALVRAGREWEDAFAQPSRRRPVPPDDALP